MADITEKKDKSVMLTLLSSIAVQLCNIVIAFIIPRAFIKYYGSDMNGVLASAKQFSGYLLIMKSSMSAATCYKFVEFKKKDDYDSIRSLYVTLGDFYKKISTVIFGISLLFAFGYALTSKSETEFKVIVAIFLFYELQYVISYMFFAKYDFFLFANGLEYVNSLGSVVCNLSAAIIQFLLIRQRVNILIVCSVILICDVLKSHYIRYRARKEYPYLFEKEARIDGSLISQKWDSLISGISSIFVSIIPVIGISVAFGSAFVSVYSVYESTTHVGASVLTMCCNGILPVVGGDLTGDRKEAEGVFRKLCIILYSIGSVICTCLCGMMMYFIDIYIKDADMSYIYPLMPMILILSTWVSICSLPLETTLKSYGLIDEIKKGYVLQVGISLALTVALVFAGRFDLMYLGVLIGNITKSVTFLRICHNKIGIDKDRPVAFDYILWTVITIAASLAGYMLLPRSGGVGGFILFAAITLTCSLIITFAVLFTRYKETKTVLQTLLNKLLKRG